MFLDPPYELEREYAAVLELLGGIAAAVDGRAALGAAGAPEEQGALRRTRMVKQGDNALSFYAAAT